MKKWRRLKPWADHDHSNMEYCEVVTRRLDRNFFISRVVTKENDQKFDCLLNIFSCKSYAFRWTSFKFPNDPPHLYQTRKVSSQRSLFQVLRRRKYAKNETVLNEMVYCLVRHHLRLVQTSTPRAEPRALAMVPKSRQFHNLIVVRYGCMVVGMYITNAAPWRICSVPRAEMHNEHPSISYHLFNHITIRYRSISQVLVISFSLK